jgi:hypothetical protein
VNLRRTPQLAALVVGVALAATACGGHAPAAQPVTDSLHDHPDLAAFLRLPVASPSSCPPTQNGTTAGRRSPWVGTVDVSVFLPARATPAALRKLRATVAALPHVRTVFVETRAEAYAEFQRLYTCSKGVPATAVPPSLRLVLDDLIDLQTRDALVARLLRLPGVATVSCDPASPCVDVVRSATPTPAVTSG